MKISYTVEEKIKKYFNLNFLFKKAGLQKLNIKLQNLSLSKTYKNSNINNQQYNRLYSKEFLVIRDFLENILFFSE